MRFFFACLCCARCPYATAPAPKTPRLLSRVASRRQDTGRKEKTQSIAAPPRPGECCYSPRTKISGGNRQGRSCSDKTGRREAKRPRSRTAFTSTSTPPLTDRQARRGGTGDGGGTGVPHIRKASFILFSRSEKAPFPVPETRDANAFFGTKTGSSERSASLASSDCKR